MSSICAPGGSAGCEGAGSVAATGAGGALSSASRRKNHQTEAPPDPSRRTSSASRTGRRLRLRGASSSSSREKGGVAMAGSWRRGAAGASPAGDGSVNTDSQTLQRSLTPGLMSSGKLKRLSQCGHFTSITYLRKALRGNGARCRQRMMAPHRAIPLSDAATGSGRGGNVRQDRSS